MLDRIDSKKTLYDKKQVMIIQRIKNVSRKVAMLRKSYTLSSNTRLKKPARYLNALRTRSQKNWLRGRSSPNVNPCDLTLIQFKPVSLATCSVSEFQKITRKNIDENDKLLISI